MSSELRRSAAVFVTDLPRALVLDHARALPGLLVVGVVLAWTSAGGGYALTDVYPGALFLLALLVAMLVADGEAFRFAARSNLLAVGLFGVFAVWSISSILWAGARDDAWDGGNRVVMYLTVLAVVGLVPVTPRRSALLLGAFALGISALTAWAFFAGDPATVFSNGRLAEPVGYASATAALCLIALWPALALAAAREAPVAVRAVMFGCAAVLVQFALLAESRGAVVALPLAALVYVALVPCRPRALVLLVFLAVAAYLTWEPLTDVFGSLRAGSSSELIDARTVVAGTFVVAAASGLVLAFVDRRLPRSSVVRWAGRLFQVAVLAALFAGGGLWIASGGSPLDRAESAWTDFKSGYPDSFGDSRLSGELGTNRYDFWTVGLKLFRADPLVGIGADNFSLEYVRDRQTAEEPTYPHSIAVEVLSQTGATGATLLAAVLIAAIVAWARKRRAQTELGSAVSVAALAGFVYWLFHASVDWFWELPVMGAAAFLFLGLAMATSAQNELPHAAESRRPTWVGVVAFVACLAAMASFVFPWLSAAAVEDALAVWRTDSQRAYERLAQARQLNPLTDRPDMIAGVIAGRRGDVATMRHAFERAVERDPENWYSRLELGIAYSLSGDDENALAELALAARLNPRESVIDDVRADVEAGVEISPSRIDERFFERVNGRVP